MPDIPIGALPKRPKRPSYKTVRHSRIDHLLAAAGGAEEYEAVLLDPRTTAKDAQAWLLARGHPVSRSAVDRHRRRFLIAREAARLKAEEAGRVAGAVAAVFRQFGPEQSGQFLLHGHQFLLFKRLMEMEQEEFNALPLKELRQLAELVFRSVRAHAQLPDLQPAAQARPPQASPQSRPGRKRRQFDIEPPDPNLTEAQRHDAMMRKIWSILEPNRPIEMFLGDDPAPAAPPPPGPGADTGEPS